MSCSSKIHTNRNGRLKRVILLINNKVLLWEILLFILLSKLNLYPPVFHGHRSNILLFIILHFSTARVILLTFVDMVLLGVDSISGILTFKGE